MRYAAYNFYRNFCKIIQLKMVTYVVRVENKLYCNFACYNDFKVDDYIDIHA